MGNTTARAGQRGKSIEEKVSYGLGHRIRFFILTLLNEGVYSPDELAHIIGERTNNVSHHVRELLDAGAIELAETKKVRNTVQHFYRAVEMPYYSDAEIAAMPVEQRQEIIGLTIQCMMAETLSAFAAGKMQSDPRLWLAWRWYNVDRQGRDDIADEQARFWKRIKEIEVESTNRRAESGEQAESIVVASLGFPRERTAPNPPIQQTLSR